MQAEANGLKYLPRQARYAVRSVVSCYPTLYLPLARRKYRGAIRPQVLDADSEIVIDGFRRSGNTFAVTAFQLAQPQPVKVAHHLHAPAHLIGGVRSGIPVMAIIREPQAVVLSEVLYEPGLSVRQSLGNYVRFYETLLPFRESFVVAAFNEVTTDFGRVIERLNERFDSSFAAFIHNEENVRKCFRIIDQAHMARLGRVIERTVPRPSTKREALKERLAHQYFEKALRGLRAKAEALFHQYGE